MVKELGSKGENEHRFHNIQTHPSSRNIPPEALAVFTGINREIEYHAERFKESYEDHFTKSKREIIQTAEQAPKGKKSKALVLGAGNCSDIPLEELTEEFDSVTLVELDTESTEKAIKKLKPKLQSKITLVTADISGITGEFADVVEKASTEASSKEDFVAIAGDGINRLDVRGKSPNLGTDYTFVCSQLVMSQLAGIPKSYMATIFESQYRREFPSFIRNFGQGLPLRMHYLTTALQQEHVNYLARLTAPDGTVHLADTYDKWVGNEPDIQLIQESIVKAELARHFTSITAEPAEWFWDQIPGLEKFKVVSNSLKRKLDSNPQQ